MSCKGVLPVEAHILLTQPLVFREGRLCDAHSVHINTPFAVNSEILKELLIGMVYTT